MYLSLRGTKQSSHKVESPEAEMLRHQKYNQVSAFGGTSWTLHCELAKQSSNDNLGQKHTVYFVCFFVYEKNILYTPHYATINFLHSN